MFFNTQTISMGGSKNKTKDKGSILKQLEKDRNRRLQEKKEKQASIKIQRAIRKCLTSIKEFDNEYKSQTLGKRIASMSQLREHLNNTAKFQIACAKAFPYFFEMLVKFPPIRIRNNQAIVYEVLQFIRLGANSSCTLDKIQNWELKTYEFFKLLFKFLLDPFYFGKEQEKQVIQTVCRVVEYVRDKQFSQWMSKMVKQSFFLKKFSAILKEIEDSLEFNYQKQNFQFILMKRIFAIELGSPNVLEQNSDRKSRPLELILRMPGTNFEQIIQEGQGYSKNAFSNLVSKLHSVRHQISEHREDKSTISLIGNSIKLIVLYFLHNKQNQDNDILEQILELMKTLFSSKSMFIRSYLKNTKKKENLKISRELSNNSNISDDEQSEDTSEQRKQGSLQQVKQAPKIHYQSDPRFFLAKKPKNKLVDSEQQERKKKKPHLYIPSFDLELQQLQNAIASLNDQKLISLINTNLNLNNSVLIDTYITILNFLSLFDQQMKQNLSHKFHSTLMKNQDLGIHLFEYVQASTNRDYKKIIDGTPDILSVFQLLCNLYYHSLLVIDDFEFKGEAKSKQSIFHLQLDQLKPFAKFLNKIVLTMHTVCKQSDLKYKYGSLPGVVKTLVNTIYQRQRRCQLFEDSFWLQESVFIPKVIIGKKIVYTLQLQSIIKNCPHCIPFQTRKLILTHLIKKTKQLNNIDIHQMYSNYINIRRQFIIEDTFFRIWPLESQFRNIITIGFVDQYGNTQQGIDGGGLFKQFMTLFCRNIFNPDMGYFIETPQHTLCPNPNHMHGSMRKKYFQTIGMIIGKGIFQGILIQPCISRVFLSKVQGKMNKADDLQYIDPVLHKNLLSLKRAQNVSSFGLYFVISEERFGKEINVPLLPGGEEILVTDENKSQYIYLIANYKLNIQMEEDAKSFRKGFDYIIPQGCLDLFNPDELLKLISGDTNGFAIQSLKQNCQLSGYKMDDDIMKNFWEILEGFNEKEKGQFLLFVTGCSRPPLMGFQSLYPKFAIQKIDSRNNSLLPESSTCVNLLRLPYYSNQTDLKTRLLVAMQNSEGFGLA